MRALNNWRKIPKIGQTVKLEAGFDSLQFAFRKDRSKISYWNLELFPFVLSFSARNLKLQIFPFVLSFSARFITYYYDLKSRKLCYIPTRISCLYAFEKCSHVLIVCSHHWWMPRRMRTFNIDLLTPWECKIEICELDMRAHEHEVRASELNMSVRLSRFGFRSENWTKMKYVKANASIGWEHASTQCEFPARVGKCLQSIENLFIQSIVMVSSIY